MKTLEGLHALIKSRLIEKKGNVKLVDNEDIILYGKALGINENQLLFKVLEIEETIDWAEEELKRTRQDALKTENANTANSTAAPSSDMIYCGNCNTPNEKGSAKFCIECGAELVKAPAPKAETEQRYESETINQQQNNYSTTEPEKKKKSKLPMVLGILALLIITAGVVGGISYIGLQPSPEKLIAGKWKIEDFKTNQPIPAGMEEVFKQMMDQLKANSSFEFKADKTVIVTMSGVANNGTWSVDKEGKKLTMTDNQSKKPSDANIEELTDKKLVLKMEDSGQAMTMTLVHAK